ncbi:MAG TPA: class I SAM-dependent methyltransferase [Candidatus Limnocylindrales bacterium]|nr:class I SAM-dependent methyltransferase [Candidatus Limnocylindrales bacterium]
MAIHPSAAVGFQAAAEAYERGRPAYAREAVDRLIRELAIGPRSRVLDLAAGTGKLTRMLVSTGASIVAVEPVPGMRREFTRLLPGIQVLDGTAEAIPLADRSVDAVTVGQAFHWFDGERALPEIHRVLRPGGGLGLIWQARDPARPWIERLNEIIDRADDGHPRFRTGAWREAFDQSRLFEPIAEAEYRTVQRGDRQLFVDRVASISYVAAMPDDQREVVLDAVRTLLATEPDTAGQEVIELPYRAHVYWTRARPGPGR